MDISDYTRIVFDKIQKFEPEHATKIIGYLLLRDEQELAQLASCPDDLIRQVAFKAKTDLQRLAAKQTMLSISPSFNPQQGLSHLSVISPRTPRTPTSPPSFQVHSPYWDPPVNNANQEFRAASFSDFLAQYRKQTEMFLDPVNTGNGGYGIDYYGSDASAAHFNGKVGRRLLGLSEFPTKICHYFKQGYCKNGSSCRFYHGPAVSESFYGNEAIGEEPVISPGSLAQLESEIIELLKQKGSPISIASLPMAYYDKYKKVLQHDGYLTESQRHGKSGFSLTKLLVRLSNNIRLIDRPHGQHDVVLAEDAPKFIPKGEYAQNISASRQIYLTFPADSTFSEEDVSNYFNTFGCVQDVRIPSQQRRMFGFVTFVDSETVKTILDKGNPHYVRGSRVLVKPYREKGKINERKYPDRAEHPFCYSPHYADMDSELYSTPRSCGKHRALRRQLIEEQEQQALELQRSRFAELQFAQKSLSSSPHFGFSMDDLRITDDHFNFQTEESFGYALDEKPKHTGINVSDDNSNQGLNLPDSPFSFQ